MSEMPEDTQMMCLIIPPLDHNCHINISVCFSLNLFLQENILCPYKSSFFSRLKHYAWHGNFSIKLCSGRLNHGKSMCNSKWSNVFWNHSFLGLRKHYMRFCKLSGSCCGTRRKRWEWHRFHNEINILGLGFGSVSTLLLMTMWEGMGAPCSFIMISLATSTNFSLNIWQ